MLFIKYFAFLCLIASCAVGKSSMRISKKVDWNRLQEIRKQSQNGLIQFNTELFKEMVFDRSEKRDFNLFLLFNALDEQTNCMFCKPTHDVFLESSQIFEKNVSKDSSSKIFFGTIELMKNIEAFKLMDLKHVPVVMHFGPNKREPTIFTKGVPNDKNAILMFIFEQSQSKMKGANVSKSDMDKVYNFVALSFIVVVLCLGLFGFFKLDSFLKSSILWSALITVFVVLMLSGHMWTKIRNVPFFAIKSTGKYFVAQAPQSQLGAETGIVFFLTSIAAFSLIILPAITSSMSDLNTRRISAMICSLVFMACHSGLHRLFSYKLPGYSLEYII